MKKLNLTTLTSIAAGVALLTCVSANATPSGTNITINLQTGAIITNTSPLGAVLNPGADTGLGGFGLGTLFAYSIIPSSYVPFPGLLYIYAGPSDTDLIDVIGFLDDGPSYMVLMSTNPGSVGYQTSTQLATDETKFGSYSQSVEEGAGGVTVWEPTGQYSEATDYIGFADDGGSPEIYTFDAPVPDGGTTASLLGIGLIALAALSRRLRCC